jgi:hypothetical protein
MSDMSDLMERQMNMDYSICNALHCNSNGLSEALVEYDVACSWSINFSARLQSSRFLSLPEGMDLIPAVGKFHLTSHRGDCFAKFSLNFVHGAGQQDGEILETLWASLNKAAGSIRAMSKAHRQEVLDDHMRDSNWKKLILIGMFLCSRISSQHHSFLNPVKSLKKKLKKAVSSQKKSLDVFNALDSSVDQILRQIWLEQEHKASLLRGNHLNIYDVQLDQG